MLFVYAGMNIVHAFSDAKHSLPKHVVDLSNVCASDLVKAVHDFCNHNANGHIFLGFLEPLLMLHPTEETLMRRGFTKCDMTIVVSNPHLLPLSWKNGTKYLKVIESTNVDQTKVIDDGSTPHVQHEVEHGRTSPQVADQRNSDQSGKTGCPPKRRKQARQDKAPKS